MLTTKVLQVYDAGLQKVLTHKEREGKEPGLTKVPCCEVILLLSIAAPRTVTTSLINKCATASVVSRQGTFVNYLGR